jgi:hypothetical protein
VKDGKSTENGKERKRIPVYPDPEAFLGSSESDVGVSFLGVLGVLGGSGAFSPSALVLFVRRCHADLRKPSDLEESLEGPVEAEPELEPLPELGG